MRDDQGRFVKGESGNPGGRPKDAVRKLLEEQIDREKFVQAMLKRAYEGDPRMITYVFDQLAGKAPDILANDEDREFVIRIKRDK